MAQCTSLPTSVRQCAFHQEKEVSGSQQLEKLRVARHKFETFRGNGFARERPPPIFQALPRERDARHVATETTEVRSKKARSFETRGAVSENGPRTAQKAETEGST